jgi:hypothetical protein
MTLSWRHEAVLAGILRDERAIAAQGYHGGDHMDVPHRGRHRLTFKRAAEGFVPMNLSGWLGRGVTPSDSVLFSRVYSQLEKMRLVERVNLSGGARTTHLRLTEAGRKVAEGLLPEEDAGDAAEPLEIGDLDWSSIELPPETADTENAAQ